MKKTVTTLAAAAGLALVALAGSALAEEPAPERAAYVVLAGVAEDDPYHEAAARVARHHGAPIVRFDPARPDAVLPRLRSLAPADVAIVLRPEALDVNFARRFLGAATRVDEDPFADFAYGVFTGATAKEALAFADRAMRAHQADVPARVGHAGVWGQPGTSRALDTVWQVGTLRLPQRELRLHPQEGGERDQAFLDAELASLEDCGAIILGGHGMPWEVVSGPQAADVERLDLFPAVAFSWACHNGVTVRWPDREFAAGRAIDRIREIEPDRSFALAMLRAGVAGYVGYVNPRPAGPELMIDFGRVLAGASMGEARRRDLDKVVLGYLGFGEPGITVPEVEDGGGRPLAELDAVRHVMLEGGTGGVLFGDPAFRPFPAKPDALPIESRIGRDEGGVIEAVTTLKHPFVYLFGADPYRKMGDTMALKVYDRLPLPDDAGAVRDVEIAEVTWGGASLEGADLVWAVEHDRGRRWLHVKTNLPRAHRAGDLVSRVRVVESDGPEEDPRRGE